APGAPALTRLRATCGRLARFSGAAALAVGTIASATTTASTRIESLLLGRPGGTAGERCRGSDAECDCRRAKPLRHGTEACSQPGCGKLLVLETPVAHR